MLAKTLLDNPLYGPRISKQVKTCLKSMEELFEIINSSALDINFQKAEYVECFMFYLSQINALSVISIVKTDSEEIMKQIVDFLAESTFENIQSYKKLPEGK